MQRNDTPRLSDDQAKDLAVILEFVLLYCREKHLDREKHDAALPAEVHHPNSGKRVFCSECADLLTYAIQKRIRCPLDPKPTCKKCHVHCYSREYRAKIRGIMAYSGRRMVMKGRLGYLWHYFF